MWPFRSTLSERYSKLVKLIKSIDSHFQLTEDKEDSLRLHLPNYKGNMTIDFHIYLMEPQLHISFVTEIEGEKISMSSFFDQNEDQQDMFNVVMARNLQEVHNVLEKKYSEDMKDEEEQAEETSVPNSNEEENTSSKNSVEEPTFVKSWGLLDFAKEHGKMQVGTFTNSEIGDEFISCIFTKPDGTRTFVLFSAELGELSAKEIAAQKNDLIVVRNESGNYSLCRREQQEEDLSTEVLDENLSKSGPLGDENNYSLLKQAIQNVNRLSDEQRYTLYFFADMFGGGLYEKQFRNEVIKKETLAILRDYQEDLNLTESEVKYISSLDFNYKLIKLFEILRGIKNESEIDNLLITCGTLANLNRASNSNKDFYRMTQELGYSKEETKKKLIHFGFKEDSPIVLRDR